MLCCCLRQQLHVYMWQHLVLLSSFFIAYLAPVMAKTLRVSFSHFRTMLNDFGSWDYLLVAIIELFSNKVLVEQDFEPKKTLIYDTFFKISRCHNYYLGGGLTPGVCWGQVGSMYCVCYMSDCVVADLTKLACKKTFFKFFIWLNIICVSLWKMTYRTVSPAAVGASSFSYKALCLHDISQDCSACQFNPYPII
jgi:hypothetical protein